MLQNKNHYNLSSVKQLIENRISKIGEVRDHIVKGRLTRINGMTLESEGCSAPIGARCHIEDGRGGYIESEVVGFSSDRLYLIPTQSISGIKPNAVVIPDNEPVEYPVGDNLLGRIIDANCNPIDGGDQIRVLNTRRLTPSPKNPLNTEPVKQVLDVGVRAINALLTIGRGQRMGLFASSGVGKSVLLSMMTRYTSADVIVIGLIGERGREVNEFVQQIINDDALSRTVVVAVPADQSPVLRVNGTNLATTIAEYFRDQGKHVLLLLDSLTRYAQAHREISLSIGEPPVARGYPPSVYARIPQLVERAGNASQGGGSITALYTVLIEDEAGTDPVSETAKAILDGHIVLSRKLAEQGHFPAIDIEASVSRVMNQVIDSQHRQLSLEFRRMYTKYTENQDLVMVGAYSHGSDTLLDTALNKKNEIESFLRQDMAEGYDYRLSVEQLNYLMSNEHQGSSIVNIPL